MEPQTTSPLPPTEEQARIRRLRLRPPMTRKELGRALWAPLGLQPGPRPRDPSLGKSRPSMGTPAILSPPLLNSA